MSFTVFPSLHQVCLVHVCLRFEVVGMLPPLSSASGTGYKEVAKITKQWLDILHLALLPIMKKSSKWQTPV
eukprot:scaffold74081_cov14-Tisochrysis_lutea.AAC.1